MILLELMKEERSQPLMSFNYDRITGNIIKQYTFGILFNIFKKTLLQTSSAQQKVNCMTARLCLFCAFLYVSVWQSDQYMAGLYNIIYRERKRKGGREAEGRAQIISLLHSICSAIILVRITTPSAEITTLALHVVLLLPVSQPCQSVSTPQQSDLCKM